MLYLSGIHALNLSCNLLTCGDWHQSGIQWSNLRLLNSEDSIWGDYGIETDKEIPEHMETYNTANHIRALLDILADGNFALAQGMKNDFICNDIYTPEIFEKVLLLKESPIWSDIDSFMGKEYCSKWLEYKKKVQI